MTLPLRGFAAPAGGACSKEENGSMTLPLLVFPAVVPGWDPAASKEENGSMTLPRLPCGCGGSGSPRAEGDEGWECASAKVENGSMTLPLLAFPGWDPAASKEENGSMTLPRLPCGCGGSGSPRAEGDEGWECASAKVEKGSTGLCETAARRSDSSLSQLVDSVGDAAVAASGMYGAAPGRAGLSTPPGRLGGPALGGGMNVGSPSGGGSKKDTFRLRTSTAGGGAGCGGDGAAGTRRRASSGDAEKCAGGEFGEFVGSDKEQLDGFNASRPGCET
ncbi:hypothetical protein DIPPA_31322 [Diplonema papillatum]|nr:hypothetical protein DIPPA_31322 [Diplonema papillatum]